MDALNNLFTQAVSDGNLSPAGSAVITLVDHGAQIQAGLGFDVGAVVATQVLIVGVLVDDSGSMAQSEQAVRDGVNDIAKDLTDSKARDGVYMLVSGLNRGIIYPFTPVTQAPKLDASNYEANGGTPLYDQSAAFLATMIAKLQEFTDAGVPARAATFIITDGAADTHSGKIRKPEGVAPLVKDLLASEQHLVFGMGIDDGHTDFRDVFARMGIHPKCVILSARDGHAIRQAIGVASQSMVQASQARPGAQVSQAMAGGFGA